MATMDELRRALVAAHQAGNVDDARALAAAIQSMQSAPLPDAQSPDYAQGARAASAYPDEARKLVLDRETAKMPWLARFGQSGIDEAVNLGQGVTFGWAPHASAFMDKMLTGADYNEALAKFQDMAKNSEVRAGLAGKVAHGVGNVGAITALSALGLNPATYVASGGTAIGAPLLGRMAAGAMESAGMGAAENAANDRPLDLGVNAALGAATVPVAGAIGKALGWAGSRILPTRWGGGEVPPVPTAADLADKASSVYDAFENSGGKLRIEDVVGAIKGVKKDIRSIATESNAEEQLSAVRKMTRDLRNNRMPTPRPESDLPGYIKPNNDYLPPVQEYVSPKLVDEMRKTWANNVPPGSLGRGSLFSRWDDLFRTKMEGGKPELLDEARKWASRGMARTDYDSQLAKIRASGQTGAEKIAARSMLNDESARFLSPEAVKALTTAAENTKIGQDAEWVVKQIPRTLSPWALASALTFGLSGGNPGVTAGVAMGYPAVGTLAKFIASRESTKAATAAKLAIAGMPGRVEGGFTDEMAQAATPMERFLRSLIMQHANEVGPDALLPSLFTHQPSR